MPIGNLSLPDAAAGSVAFGSVQADGDPPGIVPSPATLPVRVVCRICAQITTEMVMLAAHRIQMRRDRRRTLCHVRQIAMYVCHVALQIPLFEIARAFGRDRTTVGHACHVVEDRRDDPAFDEFVAAVERTVNSVFRTNGALGHE
ncbi:helix-turn-helix domain-containing protein [Rhizobium sp. Root1220]|uniref:helix-turn-helix domain-containing protein n=1 Tax=Rhizobium sp. Root1220 TaxID=1736432 RepID=UPI0006F6A7A7|nr:helix-turn-helix domain-containing protein [Rhizobium sp. Root1220]KQV63808.1 transposase [Rhizobium sp. Root1220]